MVNINTAYYGIPTGRKCSATWDSNVKAGDIVNETIWHLYRTEDNQPIAGHWALPFDDSVYLWKLPSYATFACNSAFCISRGNTLDVEVQTVTPDTDAPLALAAMDKQSAVSAFVADPAERLAYDTTKAGGGAQTSSIFYDIPYSHYCVYGRAAVYDKSNNTLQGTTITTSGTYACRNWINADPDNRDVTIILPALYFGDNNDRRTAEGYQDDSSLIAAIVPDILSDRPIPSNADFIKAAIKEGHDDWRTDRVFCPFNQLLRNNWGVSTTTSQSNQMMIGVFQQYTYNQLRNGAQSYINLADKITGQFFRYNNVVKNFDDVVYKWELKYFDITTKQFIDNGTDITNRSGNFKILTVLNIIDKKGQSKGIASERAVKHELAYLGFYFAETEEKAKTDNLLEGDGVYLPEIVNGITTGNYFTGDDIENVPYANATSCSPFEHTPEDVDGDGGRLTTNHYTDTIGGSTNLYAFTASTFEDLMTWLNTTYSPTDETEFIQDFKGENPGEYIVSVKYFPFDLPYSGNAPVPVYVGKLYTGILQLPINKQIGGNSLYDLGSFLCQPPYIPDDFRLEYCKMLLYIPWCGYTELDPAIFAKSPDNLYHYINVKLHVDYTTGSCMGLVYRDAQLIQCVNGTCGIDIPLSAMNQGSYQNSIKQAEIALSNAETSRVMSYLGLAGSAVATIGSGLIGNLPGLAAGVMGMVGSVGTIEKGYNAVESAQYNLEHTSPSIGNVSGASPLNNAFMDQTPVLYIYRPAFMAGYDPAVYGHTIGYACNKNGHLKDFSGLTVCASWDLSGIECTAEEKTMIAQYLSGGVIV